MCLIIFKKLFKFKSFFIMSDRNNPAGGILYCLSLLACRWYYWTVWFRGIGQRQNERCIHLRRRIRKALQAHQRHILLPLQTDNCMDDYAISNYIHKTADTDALRSMENHLETCDWCLLRTWAILKKKVRLYHQITHAGVNLTPPTWIGEVPGIGKFLKGVVGFVLIALLFFLLFFIQKYKSQRSFTESGQPILRGEPPASLEIPATIWGKPDTYLHFKWQSVPEAQFYRITIWNAETGEVIIEKQLREPRLAVRVNSNFLPDIPYLWKVDAIAYQRVLRSYSSMGFTLGEK